MALFGIGGNSVQNPQDPTGGVAQARTEKIARGLMGDDLVDKYGHAMGVRPTSFADSARDAVLGATIGRDKVAAMHFQAREQYNTEMYKAQQAGLAKEQADRAKGVAIINALEEVRKNIPMKYKAQTFAAILKAQGIEPDPTAMKMFTDADAFSNVHMDQLKKGVENNTIDLGAQSLIFGSPEGALQAMGQFKAQAKSDQDLQKGALEIAKLHSSIANASKENLTYTQKQLLHERGRLANTMVQDPNQSPGVKMSLPVAEQNRRLRLQFGDAVVDGAPGAIGQSVAPATQSDSPFGPPAPAAAVDSAPFGPPSPTVKNLPGGRQVLMPPAESYTSGNDPYAHAKSPNSGAQNANVAEARKVLGL